MAGRYSGSMTLPPVPLGPPSDASGNCLWCSASYPRACEHHDWRAKRIAALEAEVAILRAMAREREREG